MEGTNLKFLSHSSRLRLYQVVGFAVGPGKKC
jgi:hypothetical protein